MFPRRLSKEWCWRLFKNQSIVVVVYRNIKDKFARLWFEYRHIKKEKFNSNG